MSTIPMQREDCCGVFAATLTPLLPDEGLDEGAYEKLVHRLLDEGLTGVYVAGNTGEWYGIDDSVRVAAYRLAARAAGSRGRGARVIAHVGGVPARRAVALARAAADAGCDAISAMPPHGGRYTYDELTDYCATLAGATPLPLIVYHIPAVSGYDFSRPELSHWLGLPNVLGMKYTSHDMFRLERLAALHPDKAILNGYDESLMQGIVSGAVGAIGATYNLLGPLAIKIVAAVRRGDLETARRGQAALNAFVEDLLAPGVTALRAFKALAAERLGWASAISPAPGAAPPPQTWARMKETLQAALALARTLP